MVVRGGRGAGCVQLLTQLVGAQELLLDLLAQGGPALAHQGQPLGELVGVDVLGAALLDRSRVQTRGRVRRPYRAFPLGPAGPGGAAGVDVDAAQGAREQPLVEGGDGDRAEADLEAVRGRHRWFATAGEAVAWLQTQPPLTGCTVLLKGSRGSRMETLLNALPAPAAAP